MFSCLWKLFQCGNIQYALIPEHGTQFLYDFQLTGEVLELPYSSKSLTKRKNRLLNVLMDMVVSSLWLVGDNDLDATQGDWAQTQQQVQFDSLLASYLRFTKLNSKIAQKKSFFIFFQFSKNLINLCN
jgi:hypothetical protein